MIENDKKAQRRFYSIEEKIGEIEKSLKYKQTSLEMEDVEDAEYIMLSIKGNKNE